MDSGSEMAQRLSALSTPKAKSHIVRAVQRPLALSASKAVPPLVAVGAQRPSALSTPKAKSHLVMAVQRPSPLSTPQAKPHLVMAAQRPSALSTPKAKSHIVVAAQRPLTLSASKAVPPLVAVGAQRPSAPAAPKAVPPQGTTAAQGLSAPSAPQAVPPLGAVASALSTLPAVPPPGQTWLVCLVENPSLLTTKPSTVDCEIEKKGCDKRSSATGICQICGKAFSKTVYLNKHLRIVHRVNSKGVELPSAEVTCALCKKKLKSKKHLQVHLKRIHHPSDPPLFQCEQCDYKTIHRYNLNRHVKINHDPKKKSFKRTLKCPHCPERFLFASHLKNHEQVQHNIGLPKKKASNNGGIVVWNRRCPLCPFVSLKKSTLEIYKHFEDEHNIVIRWENHCFENLELFHEWKSNLEKSNGITFVKRLKSYQYVCHKRGINTERKKPCVRQKKKIFCRINAFCPSEIKLNVGSTGRVEVRYMPCHVGHEGEVITSIHYKDPEDYPLDLETVEECVQDLKSNQNISKLHCKTVGVLNDDFPHLKEEDFLLILLTNTLLRIGEKSVVCIDSTRGYNHCKFQLYTILIMDENAEGVPVAFMFTNRFDENTVNIFYEKVKEQHGQIIPDVFMSAIEEILYSEWVKVMGPPKLRVYSTWHVLSKWRRSLKNVDKKGEGYKALKSMLYEFDKDKFHNLLNTVGEKLKNDDRFKDYYKEFEELYVNNRRFELWAYCYRMHSGVNMNLSLENFNKILSICGLRGRNFVKVNNPFIASLNFFRGELFNMLEKLRESKIRSKLHNLREGHKVSLQLTESDITPTDSSTWQVTSATGSDSYTVKRVEECSKCQLNCTHCEACFHEYICSCKECLVRKNMCQHIHLVGQVFRDRPKVPRRELEESEYVMLVDDCCDVEEEILYEVSVEDTTESVEARKQRLIEKLKFITDYVNDHAISDEQMEYIENQTDQIITSLDTLASASESMILDF